MQHGAAAELLARATLFHGVGGELLRNLLARGETVRFETNRSMAMAGEPADGAYFILEGSVALFDANSRLLEKRLEPGMVLSEMALLVETSHLHGALPVTETVAFHLRRDAVLGLLQDYPPLAAQIARNIRDNLEATFQTLRELDGSLAAPVPEAQLPEPEPVRTASEDAVAEQMAHEQRQARPEAEAAGGEEIAGEEVAAGAPPAQAANGRQKIQTNGAAGSGSGPGGGQASTGTIGDVLARLKADGGGEDQTPQEPERDRTASASPGPRRSHAA